MSIVSDERVEELLEKEKCLEAEVERLRVAANREIVALNEECYRAKQEIERLQRHAKSMIDEMKADNERLTAALAEASGLKEECSQFLLDATRDNERLTAALKRQRIPEHADPVQELRRVLAISQDALEGK